MEQHVYFRNLDASRFFAFVLVFLAHCFYTSDEVIRASSSFLFIYQWGKVGVLGLEYFFVLSSFLISYIILTEHEQTGKFNMGNFLARRSLRVWPLYFLIVILGYLIYHLGNSHDFTVEALPPLPYLLFFWVNYYIIQNGTAFLFFIAFLWSISVEEQFYLVWAFLMKVLRHRFRTFCSVLILVSLAFRWYWQNDDAHLYFHTVSALGNFGVGGLLAASLFYKDYLCKRFSRMNKTKTALIYLVLFSSILFYHQLMEIPFFNVFSRLYFSLLFGFFIADQTIGKNRWFNAGHFGVFGYLGKISYGLYCFHGVVITALSLTLRIWPLPQNPLIVYLIQPLVIFCATVLISHFSYRYFESVFLRFKNRFYTFQP